MRLSIKKPEKRLLFEESLFLIISIISMENPVVQISVNQKSGIKFNSDRGENARCFGNKLILVVVDQAICMVQSAASFY